MLADILPTGYEVGVLNGVVRPGDVVAVVGAGPVGLAAIMGARLFSPSHIVAIDLSDSRLEAAKQFGADITINNSREDADAIVAELTGGLGADVSIEAVGVPATFEQAVRLARPGGHVANIGVHGEPVTLHLEDLWIRDRHDHDRARRHVHHPDTASPGDQPPARGQSVRDPSLHPRPVRGGVRRVRQRRRHRRAESRPHPDMIASRHDDRSNSKEKKMKRRTLDVLFSVGGLALAVLLLVLGLVMTSNANFAKSYVKDQLSQQNITFKTADTLTPEEEQSACLVKYAGPAAHHRQAGRVLRQRLHRPARQVDRRRPDLRRPRRAAGRASRPRSLTPRRPTIPPCPICRSS